MATETKRQVPVSVQERETTPALGGMPKVEASKRRNITVQ